MLLDSQMAGLAAGRVRVAVFTHLVLPGWFMRLAEHMREDDPVKVGYGDGARMKSANSASVHTRAGTGSLPASTRAPQRAGMTISRPVATLFRLTRPSSTPTCVDPGRVSMNESVERTAATPVAVSTSKCGTPLRTDITARSRPVPTDNVAARLSPPSPTR